MSKMIQLALESLFDAALETLDEFLSATEKTYFERLKEKDAFESCSYPP